MTDLPDLLDMPVTPSADAYLLVEDLATGAAALMTLAEAEARTQIDRDEIEWALEAYGLCESMDHVIRDSRPSVEIGAG
ncbi:hypothetical protein GGR25_004430 [Kaistia hirudinis]|uniref:Uncharacterized protein n=1 Tax=Kaistia hirudinis TaxID=1293440 RepID=A0A840AW97_9HYPH|nr:hypothetical protein [Kaistia hirudinis]MBB3933357.1 hypothetical protein [Kaistia hirudinis]